MLCRVSQPSRPDSEKRTSLLAGLSIAADFRRDLIAILGLFVTLRVVLGVLGALLWYTNKLPGPCHFELALDGWTVFPPLDDQGIAFPLVGVWERWDGCWYTNIAANGYVMKDSVSFWPLYPAFASFAGQLLGGDIALGGMIVNGVAYVLAMVGLVRLVRLDFGRRVADRTVLFISVFPAAFYFFAPFSEAVFLASAVWAIYGARQHLWLVAGVAAMLAGFSRIQGIFLMLPIGWEAVRYWWLRGLPPTDEAESRRFAGWNFAHGRARVAGVLARLPHWRVPAWPDLLAPVLAVALPLLAFATFMVYAKSVTGQTPFESQSLWGGTNYHAPWETLTVAWNWAAEHHEVVVLLNVVVLAGFLVGIVVGLFRLPLSYSLFAAPQVLIAAIRIQPTPLTSTLRLMLVVFPVFVLISLGCKDRRIERAWLLLSTVLLAYLVSLYFQGDFVA